MNLRSSRPIRLGTTLLTLILGGLQTVMPLSTDLYLPALPRIASDLQVSAGEAQYTLAVFMIGVALGQIVYGPITDKYGRKPPLLFGLVVYIIGSVACALAPTITALIAGRFLQALGASASAVITSAIARDLWSGKMLADRLSLLFLVVGAAPILAPTLGGLMLAWGTWNSLFWCLGAFGIMVAFAVTMLPETSSSEERTGVRLRDAANTYLELMRNAPFMLFALTGACSVGVLLAYITGSSFVYIETLGVTPSVFAVLFGVNAVGFIGASQFNRLLLRHGNLFQVTRRAVIATLVLTLVLFVVVASGQATTLILRMLFFAMSAALGGTIPNIPALAFSTVERRMGSAAALQGTMQSVFGALAGGLVGAFGNGATLPLMGIMTAFAVLATFFLFVAHRVHPESPIAPPPIARIEV